MAPKEEMKDPSANAGGAATKGGATGAAPGSLDAVGGGKTK